MYLLALSAVWLQGPSHGSPFTDASLPFEQLKAPPATAFDILMISLAMILLSAIAAGVFLGVSKLGSIEEVLRKQAARQAADAAAREERLQALLRDLGERVARGANSGGMGGGAAGKPDWLNATVDRLVASIERLEQAQKGGASQLANTLAAMAARQSAMQAGGDRSDAVDTDSASAGSSGASLGSSEPNHEALSGRVTSFLEREGFHDVRIVTAADEIDAALVHSGQLIVEARREGAIHKGRVSLQNGYPVAVELRPGHSIFP